MTKQMARAERPFARVFWPLGVAPLLVLPPAVLRLAPSMPPSPMSPAAGMRTIAARLCLASFSLISIAFAGTLAGGGSLARALCAFVAVFWTLRLVAGMFVFDLRPYLTNSYRRIGYHALNIVFAYLPVVYGLAASHPRWLK
jgi:hypothetical protein